MREASGPPPDAVSPTHIALLEQLRSELAASAVALFVVHAGAVQCHAVAGDEQRLPVIDEAALWQLATTFRAAPLPGGDGGDGDDWCVATAVSRPDLWGWLVAVGHGPHPVAVLDGLARHGRAEGSPATGTLPPPGADDLATWIREAVDGRGGDRDAATRRFLECTVDGYVVHDDAGRIVAVNDSLCRQTGYPAEALQAMGIDELVAGAAAPPLATARTALRLGGRNDCRVLATRLRRADGSEYPAELRLGYVRQTAGAVFMALVTPLETGGGQDDLPLSPTPEAFEATDDAVLILDRDRIVECNPAAVRMFGLPSREALLRATPWSLAPRRQPDGRESREKAREMRRVARERHFHRFEWQCRGTDGRGFPVEATMSTVRFRGRTALQVMLCDISHRKSRESEIERLAYYDPLTELPNRRLLQSRARGAIAAARRNGHQSGVLYLDLDRFKDINETQGHEIGDALLIAAAERLQGSLRDGDLLARLGGDEFAVLMPEVTPGVLAHTAARLLDAVAEPFLVHGTRLRVTASIGAVICPRDGVTLHELLKHADIAMYQAKTEGYAYRLFEPEHGEAIRERVRIERSLAQALEHDEIQLAFQPRVRCADGTITSVEALARWRSANGREVSPARFIPVAEASGLIHPLGRRVLTLACRQAAAWEATGHRVRVAVNISARELRQQGFHEAFLAILEAEGVAPQRIEIEITESSLMMNAEERIGTLGALRAAGVYVSVDDFGTGYSSLSYLKRLPVDALKIDKSFVGEMTEDPLDAGIIDTILALARSLGLETIAEGVETEAQERALVRMGCSGLQGYRYFRPAPADAITARLSEHVPLTR